MHGGYLLYALPLEASVVYPLGVSCHFQIAVDGFSPCLAPFLGIGSFPPVGGGYGLAFVGTLFRVIDFVALRVKYILLFLLISPRSVLTDGAHCQHDMRVRISVLFVVYGDVGAHSRRNKSMFHIIAHKGNALRSRQFFGQSDFDFPRKL